MPDIEPVKQEFDEAVKTKDDNEKDLSDSHEASILYQQDVVSTENTISEIQSVGQEASNSCSKCAGFAATATSTGVKDCESSLASLAGLITTSTDSLKTDVYEKIKTASLAVYDEKKEMYTENNTRIDRIISGFESNYTGFNKQKSRYEEAVSKLNDSTLTSNEKSELIKERDNAKERAINHYDTCKGYVPQFNDLNTKNRELLNQFLKTN